MAWITLLAASLVVWGLCGAVIGIGRQIWSLRTTLYVHLIAALDFRLPGSSTLPKLVVPEFDPLLRAGVIGRNHHRARRSRGRAAVRAQFRDVS